MSNSVRYYDSTMSGAPVLSGTAGTLIAVLDACLVDGFGEVTLDSLVIEEDVATATISTGHGFVMVGNTGPVIRIAGATPNELNVDWRVLVTSSTTFTFATTGITDKTATGTITAKRAPAGFSKAFSGTNKAAYRADEVQSTRLYLRIDDTGTTSARICGYETMSDVDTGTGLFPTDAQISGGGHVYKATGTGRPWILFSDGRMIYFFCDTTNSSTWPGGFVFGDVDSYVAADAFGCVLIYSTSASGSLQLFNLNSTTGSCLARSYTQMTSSILSARYSHNKCNGLGSGAQPYPSPSDNRIHLWPVECWNSTTTARGLMPGLWCPVHNSDTPHGFIFDNVPNFSGRTLKVQTTGSASYKCVIDLTGPWRTS